MVRIYGLLCPETKQIRYIGQTRKSLQERLTAHWESRMATDSELRCWLRTLQGPPHIVELAAVEHLSREFGGLMFNVGDYLEQFVIDSFEHWHGKLLNRQHRHLLSVKRQGEEIRQLKKDNKQLRIRLRGVEARLKNLQAKLNAPTC